MWWWYSYIVDIAIATEKGAQLLLTCKTREILHVDRAWAIHYSTRHNGYSTCRWATTTTAWISTSDTITASNIQIITIVSIIV